jgi:hypothetical protein
MNRSRVLKLFKSSRWSGLGRLLLFLPVDEYPAGERFDFGSGLPGAGDPAASRAAGHLLWAARTGVQRPLPPPYPAQGCCKHQDLGVLLPVSILIGHVETGCHEIGQRSKGLQGVRATSFQVERCAALGGEAHQIQDALAVAPDSPAIDPDLGSESIR